MLANRVAENFKPRKMPKGPHGMRRVLTFDETLAQMRADEARALKVKKTLDRPPVFMQQGFDPRLIQALMADVMQGNEMQQLQQQRHAAVQQATGLPPPAVAAMVSTTTPAPTTPASAVAPPSTDGGSTVPRTLPGRRRVRDHGVPIVSSVRHTLLKEQAKSKLAEGERRRGLILSVKRRSGGLGGVKIDKSSSSSSSAAAAASSMQGISDFSGQERKDNRGKREAGELQEVPATRRPRAPQQFSIATPRGGGMGAGRG